MPKSPEEKRLEAAKASYEAAKVGIFKPGPVAIVDGAFEAPMYAEWPAHMAQEGTWARINQDLLGMSFSKVFLIFPSSVSRSFSPRNEISGPQTDMVTFSRCTIGFGRDRNNRSFAVCFASDDDMKKFAACEQAWAAYQKKRKS